MNSYICFICFICKVPILRSFFANYTFNATDFRNYMQSNSGICTSKLNRSYYSNGSLLRYLLEAISRNPL